MESNQLFRETVRAIALGDAERAKQLDAQIPDADRSSYFVFLSAVMAGAVDHHFQDDHSRDAIAKFVNELRYEYRKANPPIKPLAIETVLRAFFGEDHLLDEVTSEDQMLAAYPVIRSIAYRSEHMRDNLDKYLDDAEMLARQWVGE